MASTRTGTQLVDALIDLADIGGMPLRHPRATLLGYISDSVGELHCQLTADGFAGLLDWTDPAALPTAPPVAGENFLEIDWPSNAVSIHGVDVNTSGTTGRWYDLDPISIQHRRDYLTGNIPRGWVIRSIPKEQSAGGATLATTSGKINIYPASTLGLYHRVLYLPAFPGITNEAHVIQGYDGDWIQWVLWNSVIKALFKDDEMDPSQDAKAVRERAMVHERIKTNIQRTNRAAPIQPRRDGGIRLRRY